MEFNSQNYHSILKTKHFLFETFTKLNTAYTINRLDFNGLAALKTIMDPIKLAAQVLFCEDANLTIADTVIALMLEN